MMCDSVFVTTQKESLPRNSKTKKRIRTFKVSKILRKKKYFRVGNPKKQTFG